jgi:hypothetical protein
MARDEILHYFINGEDVPTRINGKPCHDLNILGLIYLVLTLRNLILEYHNVIMFYQIELLKSSYFDVTMDALSNLENMPEIPTGIQTVIQDMRVKFEAADKEHPENFKVTFSIICNLVLIRYSRKLMP